MRIIVSKSSRIELGADVKYTGNPRMYYEKYFGIKLPKHFHVHHLNHNREDNSIMNLVAIPKDVHNSYHKKFPDTIKITKMLKGGTTFHVDELGTNMWFGFIIDDITKTLQEFAPYHDEITNWVIYRNSLLGICRLPNSLRHFSYA